MTYMEKYESWLKDDSVLPEFKAELKAITDEKEIEDRFYQDLEFGTAGLRGVLGAGTNRMNEHTVGKATEGLARYIAETFPGSPSCAIAYDSRIKSDTFAKTAALILAAHGVKAYLFESLRPVPMLSYAVRYLKADAGIVITASHNPKQYNGYKVYGAYGGQLTDEAADIVLDKIAEVASFGDVKSISEEEAVEKGLLVYIGEDVDKSYIDSIKTVTVKKDLVRESAPELQIIYTPLHGSGNVPVRRVLRELGYTNVHIVKEQEAPDGNFPTAPYPNPENPSVFTLALEMAKEVKPDIIFGTDPDCDRIGVVVTEKDGGSRVLTGNQTGMLLTYYLLNALKEEGRLPSNGVVIKTIVSTESVRKIASSYGVELMDVLTGFKYIGEKIEEFKATKEKTFIFGFEESFGYLAGDFVRDKDAVVASMLVCEMALYYKKKGMTLYDALMEVYEKYGYFNEAIVSFTLEGKDGQDKIRKCIEYMRDNTLTEVDGVRTLSKEDYKLREKTDLLTGVKEEITLPSSNVIKYTLEDDSWFVVRPSGTEPKMKAYVAVTGKDLDDSRNKLEAFKKAVVDAVNKGFE
ncbi:phospho-sugar mutase [Youngiibacter multivorans]|uniref:Phosphoglucomutase n=1 Tax=Youngiibacter multivorans TaxID=937251 RepID=A0ABS4G2K0_9CLOT|nr:phospho-sugar mutase [Youngiibacter multivorans]MBP1918765.1 phosphoglucomutase [Youngiibacter multivorans]